jgi:hypothetical protein
VPRVVCRHGLEIKDGFGWWECSLCVKDNGWTPEQVNEAKRDLEKSYRELRSSRSQSSSRDSAGETQDKPGGAANAIGASIGIGIVIYFIVGLEAALSELSPILVTGSDKIVRVPFGYLIHAKRC